MKNLDCNLIAIDADIAKRIKNLSTRRMRVALKELSDYEGVSTPYQSLYVKEIHGRVFIASSPSPEVWIRV